jgi:type IV secretory pathway ATPase VirB11/archaellum biosynthesis ATPase
MGPGPLFQVPLLDINIEETQVTIIIERQKVIFLLDNTSHFSILPFSPRPWSNNNVIIQGISSQPLERYFTQHMTCFWEDLHFCHSFIIVPETPVPLLGWDFLSQLKAQILFPQGNISFASFFRNK